MNKLLFLLAIGGSLFACRTTSLPGTYASDQLQVTPLAKGVFVHVSYLDLPNYGPFPCNGMIIVDRGEAIVFDTPTTDSVAAALIGWIERDLGARVKAVVINHFHDDCLGGLSAFHAREIPSYANQSTIELARREGGELPQRGFEKRLTLRAGRMKAINRYFGPGHTVDNIVSYVPRASVLFGGCLVKADGAGKGNLADATPARWSNTVGRVLAEYPGLRRVIPGHGATGGRELLWYTIQLFAPLSTSPPPRG